MDHPKEDIILDDDEEKNDDVVYEEEVDFTGLWWFRIESRPVDILEPQWDNDE